MAWTWQDGERTIRFGRGTVATLPELRDDGYVLLSTERALAGLPQVAERAGTVLHVPPGRVDEIAEELLGQLPTEPELVALGGGRVIDTAKALGAVTGARVAAIPTTLSAAEMTAIHRLPTSATPGTALVRPALVVNDPDLCASQPPEGLAASAANALGHAVEGPTTTLASPVPSLAGEEAARLIDAAYLVDGEDPTHRGREQLALAALLSGYTIDATKYGLHHVLSQTLVRLGGAGHGPANAAMLPHTIAALERRAPGHVDPDGSLQALARDLAARAGATRLRDLGVEQDALARCAAAAKDRPELHLTPPPADEAELLALYEAAW
ncbi:iron-containing alcohol dehydrogenase [Conexibacter sp. SYSU D00693]|uniref:iron-containing alcohol dehydrogenase n=1 Tax=Conexibacter sp. SYSU D00693 TaxID=2812560 RepID=UPI00196A45EC|nr:iron-containing alcohol dehydrogenase [Conexibacter sp. SYSU D00693]